MTPGVGQGYKKPAHKQRKAGKTPQPLFVVRSGLLEKKQGHANEHYSGDKKYEIHGGYSLN